MQRLRALPEVEKVISMLDLVPQEQEAKSLLIEEMAMTLGPISFSPTAFLIPGHHTVPEQRAALEKLNAALDRFIDEKPGHPSEASARALRASLSNLLAELDKRTIKNDQGGAIITCG